MINQNSKILSREGNNNPHFYKTMNSGKDSLYQRNIIMSGIMGGCLDSGRNFYDYSNLNNGTKIKNLNQINYKNTEMNETKDPVTGIGVPDGDGGSIERDDSQKNLIPDEDIDKGMNEDDMDVSEDDEKDDNSDVTPLGNDDDLGTPQRANSLGNDSDNRRDNESIEGAMNNPGVRATGGGNFSMLKYFNIEFYESEEGNRTIACTASAGGHDGYYFKGE